jgi:hypothetical protein
MNFQELLSRMSELDKPVTEEPNEGNAFSGALDAAKDSGKDEFEVDGKTFPVKEDPNEGNAYGQAVQNTPPGKEIKIDGEGTGDIKREEVVADECGMPGMANMPSGMMGMRNDQADSVNMNVSINAAGSGGIKDLMNILKNIDDTGSPDGHNHSDMPAPFGQMDEPEVTIKQEPGFDSMMSKETFANEPDEMYGSVANVTQGGGDLNRPKQAYPRVQPGDNAMAESLINKLSSLYEEIKSR